LNHQGLNCSGSGEESRVAQNGGPETLGSLGLTGRKTAKKKVCLLYHPKWFNLNLVVKERKQDPTKILPQL